MLRLANFVVVAYLLLGIAMAQNAGTAPNQGAGQAGNTAAGSPVLRVLSPKPGQKLNQSFITVELELTNAAASAAGMPNFQLRLDARDPVTTNSTSYTFTGLTPGRHTLLVQLVDANNTPVAGAREIVDFSTLPAAPGPTARLRRHRVRWLQAALRMQPERPLPESEDRQELPSAAGALPLLSVIGFGVLLGGIASAMKTR